MNICVLDVVERTPDFESVASQLELRGWEWGFLHDIDGTTPIGEVARRCGVDLDSAIGFIHEATHRGLIVIPTMTLETYRLRSPQSAIASKGPTLALGTSVVAEPKLEPEPEPLPEVVPEEPSAISFSSATFDWNAPEAASDEPSEDVPPTGTIHYDARFGVEHPGGPFASADEPFAVTSHRDEPTETVARETAPVDDPFAAPSVEAHAPVADPSEPATHVEDPFAGPKPPDESFPIAGNSAAHKNGKSLNTHMPVRFDDLFGNKNGHTELVHEQAVAAAPFYEQAAIDEAAYAAPTREEPAPEEPLPETRAGSISFSFSPGDEQETVDTYEPPVPSASRVPAKMPAAPAAEPISQAPIAQHESASPAHTQSTYLEREASAEADSNREIEAKVKSWKDSLSWREQQELNEAMDSGTEKAGVIGSLLRALGVR